MVAILTHALNDEGRLGAVTHALLTKQVQAPGATANSAMAERLGHSRLLRALTWLQAAGGQMARYNGGGEMQWMTLQGCDLTTVLAGLRNDPQDLGLPSMVPLHQFRPLLETGVNSLSQLMEAGTGRLVAASKLTEHLQLHGITARDTPALRRAHNRLTLLLSADPAEGPPRVGTVTERDLPAEQRQLRNTSVAGTAPNPPAQYANGQTTITGHLRPEEATTHTAGSDQEARPPATALGAAPTAAGGRARRGGGADPETQLREATEGGLQEYVHDLRRRWNRKLRIMHTNCPPPWPAGRGSVELTDELQKWLCTSCRDATLVNYLYADVDVPTCIEAESNRATFAGQGRQRRRTGSQLIYKVWWESTVVAASHLVLYRELGYRAASTEPCPAEDAPWWAQEYNVEMVRVTWQPSSEPADQFLGTHGELGDRLVAEFRLRQEEANAQHAARQAERAARAQLPALEQQGFVRPAQPTWQLSDPWAMSRITLDTAACHPELDVQPPAGTSGYFLREPRPGEDSCRETVLHMHHPDGRWLGTIARSRVEQLRARFTHTVTTWPALARDLKAGSFVDELALLMLRWISDCKAPGMTADRLQATHGAAQDSVLTVVRAATGADTELFASPLNVHSCMASYMSTHTRDQLFGAGFDAYSRRWVGACYAFPPENETERAVRWALASAREAPADCPVLVVLHLPCERDAPHQRWLDYPEAVRLAAYRGSVSHRALSAQHWQGGRNNQWGVIGKAGEHPGYQLVAIGNEAGKRQLLRTGPALQEACSGMTAWLGTDHGAQLWPVRNGQYSLTAYNAAAAKHLLACQATARELRQGYKPPRSLVNTVLTTGHLPCTPPAKARPDAPPCWHPHTACPPKYQWRDAYFTDGSVSSAGVGAAVHCAASQQQVWRIMPNGEGPTDTIMRAELAAIFHTLRDIAPAGGNCTIFTDIQASIHLLVRALRRPHTLELHPHRPLLMQMAELLVQRANSSLQTHILKVPAHTGITGNEAADEGAKEAARSGADCDYTRAPAI